MPFVDVTKPTNQEFINIRKRRITISKRLVDNYFTGGFGVYLATSKIRVFLDKDNKKVGLQSSEEGYTIFNNNDCREFKCAQLCNLVSGKFYPKWDEEHKMLVFLYGV